LHPCARLSLAGHFVTRKTGATLPLEKAQEFLASGR
jgi:hypothetical protein